MKNINKLLHITIWILFTIIFVITIEKLSLNKRENASIDSDIDNTAIIDSDIGNTEYNPNNDLTNSSNTMINMLKKYSLLLDNNTNNYAESNEFIDCLYIEYLIIYFSDTEIDLSNDTIAKIDVKLQELINLMNMENVNDVNEMSVDAKEIAINIIHQIYQLCGLKLEHNLKGEILRISDVNGNILYVKKSIEKEGTLNYSIIIMILLIWSFLFTICISIAKDNQLF